MKRGLLFTVLYALIFTLQAQPFPYVIKFKDKGSGYFTTSRPGDFLSVRAIQRRSLQGIKVSIEDIPIYPPYLKELREFPNVSVMATSKWFNDALVLIEDTFILDKLRTKNFIHTIEKLPFSNEKSKTKRRNKVEQEVFDVHNPTLDKEYGAGYHQLSVMHGDYLHLTGNRGAGKLIAVIDAGFTELNTNPFMSKAFEQNRIVATKDFVEGDEDVYAHSTHGALVATTIAANLEGQMKGTAPEASLLLLRSEDSEAEYLAEEYFWVAAAEYADSAGADVLNTSLGYTRFDDSLQNHLPSDMDGKTTRITRGAGIAATKGMIVCNSAGNSGRNDWQKIGAPADAANVLAIGAVDSTLELAEFSSRGPSADGRIKPDLVAIGEEAIVGRADGTIGKSNGTSFSSPIMAGMIACLWQANPGKSAEAIKYAVLLSANRFNAPDTNYGYGMPDFFLADRILKGKRFADPSKNEIMNVFPNPYTDRLMVILYAAQKVEARFAIFDIQGKKLNETSRVLNGGEETYLSFESSFLPTGQGTYIMTVDMAGERFEKKITRVE